MLFTLSAEVSVSIYTEVEAETLTDAINIAQERSIDSSRWNDKTQLREVWVSDEYDGEPQNITNNE